MLRAEQWLAPGHTGTENSLKLKPDSSRHSALELGSCGNFPPLVVPFLPLSHPEFDKVETGPEATLPGQSQAY